MESNTAGWIDRSGIYHQCKMGEHAQYAKDLLGVEGHAVDAEEFLKNKGWVKVTFIHEHVYKLVPSISFLKPNEEQKRTIKEWCEANGEKYPFKEF